MSDTVHVMVSGWQLLALMYGGLGVWVLCKLILGWKDHPDPCGFGRIEEGWGSRFRRMWKDIRPLFKKVGGKL